MKILYLIRHAKSSWDDPSQDDFDRPLNERGRRDAPRMGRRLKEKDIHPDLLISSPAERALSTCKIISEKMGLNAAVIQSDERLYHASEDGILKVVHGLNDANDEVMIFAHNPGLTEFVNRLTNQLVTDNIPTCGVVALKIPVSSWRDVKWEKAELHFFDYPKSR